ncbi:hypothetical protein [Streptomyces sp. NPDC089919]|uniref:hypothetical protein n=1 Tax=Streptomyces sp. NPDC089919 TaxID=3155188 RepID=UPI00343C4F7C
MGNTRAVPVFRTTDVHEAHATAGRLAAIGTTPRTAMHGEVQLPTGADVERCRPLFRHGYVTDLELGPPPEGEAPRELPEGWRPEPPYAIEPHLPLTLRFEDVAPGRLDAELLELVGSTPAELGWWWLCWPPVPELGLAAGPKYADVQVVFNHRDIYLDGAPAADHTVFVHVGPRETDRAEWLAGQIGQRVIGPPQHGW